MPRLHINQLEDDPRSTSTPAALLIGQHIDVWRVDIATAPSFVGMLTQEELEKKDRFRNTHNRDEFVTSRGALRYLSGKYLNRSPLDLVLAKGMNGKPCWWNMGSTPLYFNNAHSGNQVLIAFSNHETGIDIERINPNFDYSDIIERCFDRSEARWVEDAEDHISAFYRLWTRKEAILKATGIGVHNDLHLVPSIKGEHVVKDEYIGSSEDWTLSTYTTTDNAMVAIAHSPDVSVINFYDLVL